MLFGIRGSGGSKCVMGCDCSQCHKKEKGRDTAEKMDRHEEGICFRDRSREKKRLDSILSESLPLLFSLSSTGSVSVSMSLSPRTRLHSTAYSRTLLVSQVMMPGA